jgi:hypothetical protein
LKCFKRLAYSREDQNYLAKTLRHFGAMISLIRENEPVLEDEYLKKIQNCLNQVSSLIGIIK